MDLSDFKGQVAPTNKLPDTWTQDGVKYTKFTGDMNDLIKNGKIVSIRDVMNKKNKESPET